MSLEVKSTNELKQPWLSILSYGAPKTGKTTFGGTMPDPLFLSFEPGMSSLRHLNVDYLEPKIWQETQGIISEVARSASMGVFKYNGKEYKSLILDPINELYKQVMDGVLKVGSGRELPSQQDWGLASDRMERLLKWVASLPCHILFTAVEQADKDEFTGRMTAAPLLPGKLARKVPAFVDFFFHSQIVPKQGGGIRYVLATQTESFYPAGGRYADKKLEIYEEPDFLKIYGKLTK